MSNEKSVCMLEMCRFCLAKDNLINIFKSNDSIGLARKATMCSSLNVQESDSFPPYACTVCETKFNEFYSFKLTCETSYEKLKTLLHSSKLLTNVIKVDPDDLNETHSLDNCDLSNIKTEYVTDSKEFEDGSFERKRFLEDENRCTTNISNFPNKENVCESLNDYDEENKNISLAQQVTIKNENFLHKSSFTKSFQCELCGSVFKRKSILKKHFSVHTNLKPYGCELCPKRYTRPDNLAAHKRKHSGLKPYICEVCARSFSKNQDLSMHKRIHNDERRYPCSRCNKRFKRSADLHAHMRVHTGHQPFVCKLCPKSYKSHSGLQKHAKHHNKKTDSEPIFISSFG